MSKMNLRLMQHNFSLLLTLVAACTAFVWPTQLSPERAFAATNPAFTVTPNNQSEPNSLVQTHHAPKTYDISFTYDGQKYRAGHDIEQYDAKNGTWSPVSSDITDDTKPSSDGYQVDHVTAVAPGSVWYAGTLIGHVIVGQPSSSWTSVSTGLPERTVTALAELTGDGGQIAAVGYGGYSSATPDAPGHVYVTLDGGTRWFDITNNLPDAPVSALRFENKGGQWELQTKINQTWYETNVDGQWHIRST